MTQVYKQLIESTVYNQDYVNKVAIFDKHWHTSNWQQREHSLRHDYVCRLLCNTQRSDDKKKLEEQLTVTKSSSSSASNFETAGGSKRRGSTSDDESEYKRARTELFTDFDEDELDYEDQGLDVLDEASCFNPIDINLAGDMEFLGFNMELEEEAPLKLPGIEVSSKYRFINLEEVPEVGASQSMIAQSWGIEPPKKQMDIADLKCNVFIEVKVSERPLDELWSELVADSGLADRYLYLISFTSKGIVETRGQETRIERYALPGVDMALDFLSHRNIFLIGKGINNEVIIDDYDSEVTILDDKLLSRSLKWISMQINEKEHLPDNIEFSDNNSVYKVVTCKDLVENLEDLSERSGNIKSLWKGRLLPPSVVEYTETDMDSDKSINEEFYDNFLGVVEDFKFEAVNKSHVKASRLMNAFIQSVKMIEEDSLNDKSNAPFSYLDLVKEHKRQYSSIKEGYPELLFHLGVGLSEAVYTECVEGTFQEEYEEHQRAVYVDYISKIHFELTQNSGYLTNTHIDFEEVDCVHPLAKLVRGTCNKVHQYYSKTKASLYTSMVSGFYSRIGGSYLINISKSKTSHSSIAVIPLVIPVMTRSNERKKIYQGVCIRGPHHVRDSSDRINIITIEKINPNSRLWRYTKGVHIWRENSHYLIRQNAVRRADPPYMKFINNNVFLVHNYVGELMLKSREFQTKGTDSWKDMETKYLSNTLPYFMSRISETVLMAVLGGSQEEGYYAFRRKIYMMLIQLSRDQQVAHPDIKAFCDKANECLIDSPFVLWIHDRLFRTLRHVCENGFNL